jgi:hypothetical protein
MRITKEELKQIIKEELENIMNEEYTYDILGKRTSGPKSHVIRAPGDQGHIVIPRSGGDQTPSDLERMMQQKFGGMKGFVAALNSGDETALRIFNRLEEKSE